jgi:hypothetical protein
MNRYKEIIHKNYLSAILPNIKMVDGKHPYSRDYECLSFKEYLNICFPNGDYFISDSQNDLLKSHIKINCPWVNNIDRYKYLESNNLFPLVSQVNIKDLKFYQDEINVDRLDVLVNEEHFLKPVIVLKLNNDLILQDGYHRTFISSLNGAKVISCYIF